MLRIKILLFLWAAFFLSPAGSIAQGVSVIINSNQSVSSISETELRLIASGNKTRWDDGSNIRLIINNESADTFARDYLNLTGRNLQNHWKRKAFAGSVLLPKFVETDAEVIKEVASTPGSLSFINSSSALNLEDSVRIISVK